MKKVSFSTGFRLSLLSAAALVVTLFFQGKYPGEEKSVDYPLANFTSIELGAGFEIEVTRGDQYRVTMSGEKRAVETYIPFVKGTTLRVKYHGTQTEKVGDLKVTVTLPRLHGVELAGRTRSVFTGFAADTLFISVSGESKAKFDGEYGYAWINVSGESSLTGYGLRAKSADINVSANSICEISISEDLRGNVSNRGVVRYKGGARQSILISGGSVSRAD